LLDITFALGVILASACGLFNHYDSKERKHKEKRWLHKHMGGSENGDLLQQSTRMQQVSAIKNNDHLFINNDSRFRKHSANL